MSDETKPKNLVNVDFCDGRERLFLRKTISGLSLQDKNRSHIGWFKTEQDARNWCAENNYKLSTI